MNVSESYKRAIGKVFHLRQPENRMDFKPLIEARIEMLKPHLKEFTFATLGKVGLHGEISHEQSSLYQLHPTIFATMFSVATVNLDAQGIFGYKNDICNLSIGSEGIMEIWGFTRGGFWIHGKIGFLKEKEHPWKAIYESELFIREVELSELIPIFVNQIYFTLGNFIKDIHKKQEEKFKITSEMNKVIEFEEQLLQMTR